MAGNTEEERNRADTLSKRALNWLSMVSAGAFLGTAGALYNVNNDIVRLNEAVEYLKAFGPGTGKRFTWEDGKELRIETTLLRAEIRRLRAEQAAHAGKKAHGVAEAKIHRLEKEVDECCNHNRRQRD